MSEENFVVYDGVKFELGTLEDFSDEELANPDELERQVIKAELGPVLFLPVRKKNRNYCRSWDRSEEIGFDAFGTVDFDRYGPEFDKARYKAEKLREQLRDLVIIIRIVNDRIPGKAKYKLLRLAKDNIIEVDDITDWDTWQLAKMYRRALRIKKKILELEEVSRLRKRRKVQKWLDSLG